MSDPAPDPTLSAALGTLDDRLGELEGLLTGEPAPPPTITRPEPPPRTPFPSLQEERRPIELEPEPEPERRDDPTLSTHELARSLSAPVMAALERMIEEQQIELRRVRHEHVARIDALTVEIARHVEQALGRLDGVTDARQHLDELLISLARAGEDVRAQADA